MLAVWIPQSRVLAHQFSALSPIPILSPLLQTLSLNFQPADCRHRAVFHHSRPGPEHVRLSGRSIVVVAIIYLRFKPAAPPRRRSCAQHRHRPRGAAFLPAQLLRVPSACFPSHWPQRTTDFPATRQTEEAHGWLRKMATQSAHFASTFRKRRSSDLRRRINATKWPERGNGRGSRRKACSSRRSQKLARYWATEYDWRKVEARLNALPQFITEIDGLDIHFIHVRSKHDECAADHRHARVARLDHRAAEDHRSADQSDRAWRRAQRTRSIVVIPSLPGYGFSGKPTTHRLGSRPHRPRLGRADEAPRLHAIRRARRRLGAMPSRSRWRCRRRRNCSASTPTCRPPFRPTSPRRSSPARPPPAGLSADEKHAYDQLDFFYKHGLGYAQEMANRPQTLYGIADSPVGLAAWMLDHDARSYELIARVFDGQTEGLTRDDILDNITLYWLTNTAVSSARLYWEKQARPSSPQGRHHPGCRERLSRRDLCGAAELGGAGVSQAHPLQQARQRRPLRGLGAAGALRSAELRAAFKPLR